MSASTPLLLTEKEFTDHVHRLSPKSRTCRVAVAYCGEDGYAFFPAQAAHRPDQLRVLVDASPAAVRSGLTNPRGLNRLLRIGASVRSVPGLHAKVLTFDERAAIVGSVNLSAHAVNAQIQLALESHHPETVRKVNRWFDRLWKSSSAREVSADELRRLRKLWPRGRRGAPRAPRRTTHLASWTHPPDEVPASDDYKIGLPASALKEVLRRFRTTPCPYPDYDGKPCAEAAKKHERHYRREAAGFRKLFKRRRKWTRADLEELYWLAFLNGRAAALGKNRFLGLSPGTVARKVEYVLTGAGDPFSRLERALSGDRKYAVRGFGLAAWSCLLHLHDPSSFAIVNKPVLDGLKALRVKAARRRVHGQAARYRNLCEAIRQVSRRLRLGSLSRADHFLDALGKQHFTVPEVRHG